MITTLKFKDAAFHAIVTLLQSEVENYPQAAKSKVIISDVRSHTCGGLDNLILSTMFALCTYKANVLNDQQANLSETLWLEYSMQFL